MDEFVWLHNPETGGYFNCPAAAVDDWQGMGWEVADEPPPADPSPVVAEHLAWRGQQQTRAAQAAEETDKPTTKSAARRGTQNGDKSDG